MLITNDIHIGFNRQGGTTPASREALCTYLCSGFAELLHESEEDHLVVLGDLFDDFEIPLRDWLTAYGTLANWLGRGKRLTLVAGNHDHSPKAFRVSSFYALAHVLERRFGEQAVQTVRIDEWAAVSPGVIALAHCSNQDIFTEKLGTIVSKVKEGDHVLLHANFDNNFAAQSDHSLNVTRDAARMFADRGATLVFAHEHQARVEMGGSVLVLGNQWPTSIADCLGNDVKLAHLLNNGRIEAEHITWRRDAEAGYEQVPWDLLSSYPVNNGAGFIRVFGQASSAQAGEVINAIAKFRQRSSAFVITNAVAIDGIVQAEDLPASFEVAKRFDVMQYIEQHLEAEEIRVVRALLGETVEVAA